MPTVGQIAQALGAEAAGDLSLVLTGAAEPAEARRDQIAVALSPSYAADVSRGSARAAILWPGADWQGLGLEAAVFAPRGRLALAQLTRMLDDAARPAAEIHPTAIVAGADIGAGVAVGAFSVVGPGARIGAGSRIGAHVSVAPGAEIGPDGLVHDGVRIGRNVLIGARAILHPNVVIGGDGFSFVTQSPGPAEVARLTLGHGAAPPAADPTWHRIHSLGGVVVGADVEIGANSTVDAGTIRPTRIGQGTKIDNLVQVGHNVTLGKHCLLCAQTGVAGSAVVGDRCVLGGKSGVADHIVLGADVVLAGGTIALSNVPAGRVMMGYPAVRMEAHVASYKALRRLPRLIDRLRIRGDPPQKPVPKDPKSD